MPQPKPEPESKPFDLDFINELLAQPDRAPRSNKPKDVRDNETWFKLYHNIMGTCSNQECISEVLGYTNTRTGKVMGRDRVTATINGHEMCRFCFLDGWRYSP